MSTRPDLTVFTHELPHSAFGKQHVHGFHELFLCTGGQGWHYVEGEQLPTLPGDLFVLPEGMPHLCTGEAPGVTCDCIVLWFSDPVLDEPDASPGGGRILRALCECARAVSPRIRLSSAGQEEAGRLFRGIAEEQRQQCIGHHFAISVRLRELLLLLLRDPELSGRLGVERRTPVAGERLQHALRFLRYNHHRPITVEQMARLCCMSRSHFHAVFKQETGYTLVEYLHHRRVRTAAEMLVESDMPILEIALSCGYGSLSHFYHVFRRIMGRTPREVRREAAE